MKFNINQAYGKADFTWYTITNIQSIWDSIFAYGLNRELILLMVLNQWLCIDNVQHEKALETDFYIGDQYNITPGTGIGLWEKIFFIQYSWKKDI